MNNANADARQQTLDRARAGQAWAPKPEAAPAHPAPSAADAKALALRFIEAARSVDAEVQEHASVESALAALKPVLDGQKVLAWDDEHLPASASALLQASDRLGQASPREAKLAAAVGVTACDWAIADTGSLVLVAGPGKPREASLSVRSHVALVDPARLLPDLAAALKRIETLGSRAAHINLVTGPSRTADIEMTLTRGVHGPGRLLILLAPWSGS